MLAPMPLAPALVERVLTRLGFARAPTPDYAGLAELYLAWCERVPFDNVRKRLALVRGDASPLPGIEADDFFESWLAHGTGGTCWPAAGALHALTAHLGFRAQRVVATMVRSPLARPTHGSVAIELEGQSYLLDVAMLSRAPILMEEGTAPVVDHPAGELKRERLTDGRFVVHWLPLHETQTMPCRIESVGASARDYAEAYERSRTWSPFNYAISARTTRDDHVLGLGFGKRVVLDRRGIHTSEPLTPEQRTRVLVDELGIAEELAVQLPPDEPLPAPPT